VRDVGISRIPKKKEMKKKNGVNGRGKLAQSGPSGSRPPLGTMGDLRCPEEPPVIAGNWKS